MPFHNPETAILWGHPGSWMQSRADSKCCACKPHQGAVIQREYKPENLSCCNVTLACPSIYSHQNAGERPKRGMFKKAHIFYAEYHSFYWPLRHCLLIFPHLSNENGNRLISILTCPSAYIHSDTIWAREEKPTPPKPIWVVSHCHCWPTFRNPHLGTGPSPVAPAPGPVPAAVHATFL